MKIVLLSLLCCQLTLCGPQFIVLRQRDMEVAIHLANVVTIIFMTSCELSCYCEVG